MDSASRPSSNCRTESALKVRLSDVFRATLAEESGNLGYLGLSPDRSGYHVVVPVDMQIARGVMAGNRPRDGTPFGGYTGWLYYECAPVRSSRLPSEEQLKARWAQAVANAKIFAAWAKGLGIEIEIVESG